MIENTYAIVAWADVQALSQGDKDQLIAACQETSWDTCRHSVTAPDEIILKWPVADPNPCDAVSLANTTYTYAEILVEIQDAHWTDEEPE
jgi:hypothetical protein